MVIDQSHFDTAQPIDERIFQVHSGNSAYLVGDECLGHYLSSGKEDVVHLSKLLRFATPAEIELALMLRNARAHDRGRR